MSPDDPEQFSEDRIELYKKFAGAFNKALNFKYVCIDMIMIPLSVVSMNSDDNVDVLLCRIGTVGELLEPWEMSGGAADDYYGTYWVSH